MHFNFGSVGVLIMKFYKIFILTLCVFGLMQPAHARIWKIFGKAPKPVYKSIIVKPKPSPLKRALGVGETLVLGATAYTVMTKAQAANSHNFNFNHCQPYTDENNQPYVDETTDKPLYLCIKEDDNTSQTNANNLF